MKLDRMIGILSILLQQDRVTAASLAEKFEVSRRTIYRDIESLCMAGIPMVTEQGQNGGVSIMDGYKIDRTLLSRSDMQAVLTGLRSLDSVSGTNRYAQLMEKLSAGVSAGREYTYFDRSCFVVQGFFNAQDRTDSRSNFFREKGVLFVFRTKRRINAFHRALQPDLSVVKLVRVGMV